MRFKTHHINSWDFLVKDVVCGVILYMSQPLVVNGVKYHFLALFHPTDEAYFLPTLFEAKAALLQTEQLYRVFGINSIACEIG